MLKTSPATHFDSSLFWSLKSSQPRDEKEDVVGTDTVQRSGGGQRHRQSFESFVQSSNPERKAMGLISCPLEMRCFTVEF